jgi:hypothetical protein
MEMKNSEVLNTAQALGEIMKVKLPVKAGWNLSKNMKKIEPLLKLYYECENKLVEQYAIKDESGKVKIFDNNQYRIAPAHIKTFNQERNDLLNCENTIDILKVKLSDLDGRDIEPNLLFILEAMIEDDTEVTIQSK